MTICFDIRALQVGHQNRGIGMYIKSVLEHITPDDSTNFVLYAFEKNNPINDLGIVLQFDYTIVTTPTLNIAVNSPSDVFGLFKLVTHSFKKLRSCQPDIFVQFDFALGIPNWRKTKNVVIGYDLIPLIKKNEYLPSPFFAWQHSAGKRAKIRGVARSLYYGLKFHLHYKVFQKADRIISISKATSQSFTQLLGIDKSKITTIPLAPVLTDAISDERILKKITKPYIFYVGGTDSRKRIEDIVFAFNIARGRGMDLQLVLAGNEFNELHHIPCITGRNAIMNSSYKKDIILAGFITDAEKKALYHHAHAFVFCSTYEGFGLPIIEAMSMSCPVISYNNSSIPEAAGDAALLAQTNNYVEIAEYILLLNDESKRSELVAKGIIQAENFSWLTYIDSFQNTLKNM